MAVNFNDPSDVIKKYFHDKGFTFTAVMNGEAKGDVVGMYGVSAFPTNYVISPEGKVVARFIGFDEAGIRKALAKIGVE